MTKEIEELCAEARYAVAAAFAAQMDCDNQELYDEMRDTVAVREMRVHIGPYREGDGVLVLTL